MPDGINQQIGIHKASNQKDGHDAWCVDRYRRVMDTLGARLKYAREAAGLTQAELAERVGMSGQSGIYAIEAGNSKNPTKIYEIAKACGVTVEWLQGKEQDQPLKRRQRAEGSTSKPSLIVAMEEPENALHVSTSVHIDAFRLPEIDLRGGASYGGGKTDEEWQDGDQASDKPIAQWSLPSGFAQRELGLRPGLADIIQVRGDSMDDGTAKGLSSGDRVIIDRRDTDTRQGGLFAVFDGEGVIIKQVELQRGFDPPRIVCKSLNPRYDPIPLVLDESVRVIGRVAGVISRR